MVSLEIAITVTWAYRKIADFLSVKSISLLSYVFGFSAFSVGHLLHAAMVILNPEFAELALRLFELASASLFIYPYIFRKKETILTFPPIFLSFSLYSTIIGLISSVIFLYLSTIFYRVYKANRNLNTMLLSTSFMTLFASEILISITILPFIVYGGYIARLASFILLLYFTVRIRK